jgi:hypothetical protein
MSLFDRIVLFEFEHEPIEPAPSSPAFLQAGQERVGRSAHQKSLRKGALAARPFPPIKREDLPAFWGFMPKASKKRWLDQQNVRASVKKLGTVESVSLYDRVFDEG